jgi:hypothetical protein
VSDLSLGAFISFAIIIPGEMALERQKINGIELWNFYMNLTNKKRVVTAAQGHINNKALCIFSFQAI